MKYYTLNPIGQAALTAKILDICSQHIGIKPAAFFEDAEDARNDISVTGGQSFEIHKRLTDSGNPVVLDVQPEWFDTQELEEEN